MQNMTKVIVLNENAMYLYFMFERQTNSDETLKNTKNEKNNSNQIL